MIIAAFFSDAKPTEGSRGRACGEGQFHNSTTNKCMPCSVTCKPICSRHECYALPNVQVKSGTTNVTEGEAVQLECTTSGGIPEDIRRYTWLWKKRDSTQDDTVIHDTNAKTSVVDGKFLNFAHIPYNKSGTYTCRAWNLAGMGQGSIDLNVHTVVPEISEIGVSRTDNIVTIHWKQVIGNYTAIKIKLCLTDTGYCQSHIVPNPEDSLTTCLVDADKTYDLYVIIEDGGEVVYTSDRIVVADSDPKPDIVAVVGGSVTGAVILTASGVILAVALWKRTRSRKKNNQIENYNHDDDATRISLGTIKNSTKHTYANIGTDWVNRASPHSTCTAKQYHGKPRTIAGVPVGDEPTSSDDDEGIDQYDYTDTRWLRDVSGSRHILCENQKGQTEQEHEGTYNDVRIVTHGQHGLAVGGHSQGDLAQELTPNRFDDEIKGQQQSKYEQLEPVYRLGRPEYLDFRGIGLKEFKPQM